MAKGSGDFNFGANGQKLKKSFAKPKPVVKKTLTKSHGKKKKTGYEPGGGS